MGTGTGGDSDIAGVEDGRPEPAATDSSGGRIVALEGLRGVAVVAVIAYHLVWAAPGSAARLARGGWVGVDVFLVLSGFGVGLSLLGELDRRGSVDAPRFWARRLLRLCPVLWAFLAVMGAFTVVVDDVPFARVRPSAVASGLFWVNVPLARGDYVTSVFGHLWTLAVEVHAYLLIPVLLVGLGALRVPRRWWGAAFASVAVAVMVGRWATYDPAGSFLGPYVSTLTRLDTVLWGLALAAVFRGRRSEVDRRASAIAAAVGAVWLLVVARRVPLTSTWLYRWGLDANAVAVAALIAHLARWPRATGSRLLATPPLRWLGARSYGLYLYHYGLFLAVQHHVHAVRGWWAALLAVGLSLLAAEVSYRLVEQPARRLLDRRPR
jgi:peptidoglycan/LPS O-acetylase OafA/YrhL